MALPSVEALDPAAGSLLVQHLKRLGIDRAFAARHSQPGPDTLFSPLTPSREARYSPDPALAAFRAMFCGLPDDDARETVALSEAAGTGAGPFHLRVVRGLYLFSDYLGTDPHAVMGAGETTALLFDAAASQAAGRVLDLGCGAGTLALLLAGAACPAAAVGTDINGRAIALARFNAAINGIGNVEFRAGDLYAPVAGERFDWIVSQPPYYPAGAGDTTSIYLHGGGETGSDLPRRVLEGAPAHLSARGQAIVFCAWPGTAELPAIVGHTLTETITGPPEIPGTRQCLIRVTPCRER